MTAENRALLDEILANQAGMLDDERLDELAEIKREIEGAMHRPEPDYFAIAKDAMMASANNYNRI